jgi:predicted nucleic-acid-binding protein
MRAIDTNVLVRLLAQDDAKQARAAARFIAGGGWISHLVLAEASWVLVAVFERTAAQIVDALTQLLEHESLVVQDPDVVEAALASFRQKPSLGFSDCLILEIARKAGHLPLGTFDRRLAQLDGAEQLRG